MSNALIEEIYAAVLPELAANNIEDTTANRLSALTGISAAWQEDKSNSVEKALYQLALSAEIIRLCKEVEKTL